MKFQYDDKINGVVKPQQKDHQPPGSSGQLANACASSDKVEADPEETLVEFFEEWDAMEEAELDFSEVDAELSDFLSLTETGIHSTEISVIVL